jgi:peptidoglycan/xylan/chitin deacetylase (PgdA/CDA1 family)
MSLLRSAKAILLRTRGLGLSTLVANSAWRSRRLLILCYHGVAMGEEYDSHDYMFIPAETFERRLAILKEFKANVLDLQEAVRRLGQGTLPPRSVAITFDDGWADFYVNAYPALRKYGVPVTVYLSTYYCLNNRPVFLFALRHMMLKRSDQVIEGHRWEFLPPLIDLRTDHSRAQLLGRICRYFEDKNLSGKQKDDVVAEFASVIGFDYGEFTRKRLFQLMNPNEVSEVAKGGIDIQLHTHRHRTPANRDLFIQELNENRQHISDLTGNDQLAHFCYPSGVYQPSFLPWLREFGVESATTCDQQYSSQETNPLLLPRLLDQFLLSEAEFEAWLSGFMAYMPKRKVANLDLDGVPGTLPLTS